MKHTKVSDEMYKALKAVHKQNRENEIANFGKTICYNSVVRNKKAYTRKEKHKKDVFSF